MPAKVVFVDTNVLLHFRPLEEIPWDTIAGDTEVLLVVSQPVLEDLDAVKDSPARPRHIRQRARTVLAELNRQLELASPRPSDLVVTLRSHVALLFLVHEPYLDFQAHHLDRTRTDDRLLASVIERSEVSPDEEILLATDDVGLKVKAKGRGLKLLSLPEKYRIPPKVDPTEAENQELRKQILRMQSKAPRLRLCFGDGRSDSVAEFLVQKERDFDPAALLLKLHAATPKMEHPSSIPGMVYTVTTSQVDDFNASVDRYHAECRRYVTALTRHRQRVFIRLKLQMRNEGGAPARNVRGRLHFPGGMTVYAKRALPSEPQAPDPPARPKSPLDILMDAASRPPNIGSLAAPPSVLDGIEDPFGFRYDVRETDSWAVRFDWASLAHDDAGELAPLFVAFETMEQVKGFSVEYKLWCDELPDASEGCLHVRVDDEDAQGS